MAGVMNFSDSEGLSIAGTGTGYDIFLTQKPNVTDVFDRYTWNHFLSVHCPLAFYVDRAVTPIWYVIGFTGNILSVKIWLERRMRKNNSSAVYLATLSVTDLLFLLLHVLQELKYAWGVETLSVPGVCEAYFLFSLCAQYASPILVLGFTVERWIAVCHPFKKERFCTIQRAVVVVTGLIGICFMLSSIQSYFWQYDSMLGYCVIRESASSGGDTSLFTIWTWITEMLIFLLVPVVILMFNIFVIREVKRISESGTVMLPGQQRQFTNHAATTAMLLSVSFYVIFTTLPATLVYALANEFGEGNTMLTDVEIQTDPTWRKYFVYLSSRKIVEEICLSHYACNFFLYLITGVQFRKSLVATFRCKMLKKHKANGTYLEVNKRTMWQNTYTTKV